MWIIEKFNDGGPECMVILLLINLAIIGMTLSVGTGLTSETDLKKLKNRIGIVLQLGLFALIAGVFFQCIALFQIFSIVEEIGEVAPALLAGGVKYSMITTLYGFLICGFAVVIWFVLQQIWVRKMATKAR